LPSLERINLRELYKITSEEKVFLHFGGLALRKGTTDILSAIDLIDKSLLKNACFIFSGFINDDIKTQFSELTGKLSDKVRLLIFEGFSSYEFQGHLCSIADYILLPYRVSSQSSGILGYAAQYNVPVIGTSAGLLGSLISSYKLGYVYDLKGPGKLANAMIKHLSEPSSGIDGTSYLRDNTVHSFQNCVFG
jgi:glycosyltransferase involved in cell wall biosynthesis